MTQQKFSKISYVVNKHFAALLDQDKEGTFCLAGLNPDCLTTIVNSLLASNKADKIEFHIPRSLVNEDDCTDKTALTDHNAAYIRNLTRQDGKSLLIMAVNDTDHQLDTLKEVATLGINDIVEADGWLDNIELILKDSDAFENLQAMIKGLNRGISCDIQLLEKFIFHIEELLIQGETASNAVNQSLVVLGLPKSQREIDKLFKGKGATAAWKNFFETTCSKRYDYFVKGNRPPELTKEKLEENFNQLKDQFPDKLADASFVAFQKILDDQPQASLHGLLAFDWEADHLKDFVEKARKRVSQNLAEKTKEFLLEKNCSIYENNQDFIDNTLVELVKDKKPSETAFNFYDENAELIKTNSELKKDWEKFLLAEKVFCTDFISGLLTAVTRLARQTDAEKLSDYRVRIKFRKNRSSTLQNFNSDALAYFRYMYSGLLEHDDLFVWEFSRTKSDDNWLLTAGAVDSAGKQIEKNCDKRGKNERQLNFDIALIDSNNELVSEINNVSVQWEFPKDTIAYSLKDDLNKLNKNKANLFSVIFAQSNRSTNSKGTTSTVSLSDPDSLGTGSHGHLCARINNKNLFNIKEAFEKTLEDIRIDPALKADISTKWNVFANAYLKALESWVVDGIGSNKIVVCHDAYCDLMRVMHNLPTTTTVRDPLFRLLFAVGTASFCDAVNHYAVVAPWHPLRMYSLYCRFHSRMQFMHAIMNGNIEASLTEKSEFFTHLVEEKPMYFDPQVVAIPQQSLISNEYRNLLDLDWDLLRCADTELGYSLYTQCVQDSDKMLSSVGDYSRCVQALIEAVDAYLTLYPQEKDNFIIALPDAVNKELPIAVAEKLYATYLKPGVKTPVKDPKFTLKVGHFKSTDPKCNIYEDLTRALHESDPLRDQSLVSDSIGNTLRIQVCKLPSRVEDRDCHIALLDRFVSSHAELDWQEVSEKTYDPLDIMVMPGLENTRYFDYTDAKVARTFVVTPSLTKGGALYLRGLGKQRNAPCENGLIELPTLSVSTRKNDFDSELRKTHEMADWVLICDNLLDKRQLLNNNIEVVRYKNDIKRRQTEILSSTLPTNLFECNIQKAISGLVSGTEKSRETARLLLQNSYEISGYIALRAARRMANARELAGLCLSRYCVNQWQNQALIDNNESLYINGVYLLDDYTSWFELLSLDSLADLFNLCVSRDAEGRVHVHLTVTEAKFCEQGIANLCARKSQEQIKKTVGHIKRALTGSSNAGFDQKVWFNRLADLVLASPRIFHNTATIHDDNITEEITSLAISIRAGNFKVSLNGFSHVYIHDSDYSYANQREKLDDKGFVYQETMGSRAIADLLMAMTEDTSVTINFDKDAPVFKTIEEGMRSVTPAFTSQTTVTIEPNDQPEPEVIDVVQTPASVEPTKQPEAEVIPAAPQEKIEPAVEENVSPVLHDIPRDQRYAPGFEAFVNKMAKDSGYSPERQAWADQASETLKQNLQRKNIRAVEIRHLLTPNGCLVCFEGHDTLTTSAINALKENLMTTAGLEITFVRPALGQMQIMLKSATREAVSMWSIWKNRTIERNNAGINMSFAIGLKEVNNQILYLNPIKDQPHTLVAGGTGSGKTVLVQMLLLDIAATNPSHLMKFYMIDPKRSVDYTSFMRLPHLAAPQVEDQQEAEKLIQSLVDEMNRRLDLFKEKGAKDLRRYNAIVAPEERLPVLWLIHDEFAAWMSNKDYANMISEALTVLTVQARATGIYLVLIAQRPDKNVVPMQIRDNLGNRLALKLPTEQSSTIALGEKGAELLLGKGHLAAKLQNEIIYAQVPFLNEDEDEIDDAIDQIIAFDKQW